MTTTEILGAQLRQQVLDTNRAQARAIVAAARPGAIGANGAFVFFAAFDGTNNDLLNAGNAQNTNVAQLYEQVQAATGAHPSLRAHYFAGPGSKGTLSKPAWLEPAVTRQVIDTADRAYRAFALDAARWLAAHPGAALHCVVAAFSRGNASAAIFSQMLFARGLADPADAGRLLLAPGRVPLSAGILFDPVMTGVQCNLAFAPNARHLVQIRAQDEYRRLFRAADYSAQSCVTCIDVLGNHCDVGGGYDNGLAALTLEAATSCLRAAGLPLAPVAPARVFAGVDAIAIHSEERDDAGQPKWDVYDHFGSTRILRPGPRLNDRVATPAVATAAGDTLTLYNGEAVTVARA